MFVRSPPNGEMWLGQDSGDRCGDASDRPPMRQILGKGGLMATQVRHNRMPATVDHTYRMKWEARQVDEWMGISMEGNNGLHGNRTTTAKLDLMEW